MSSGDWQEEGGDWLPPRHPVAEPPTPEEAPPFLLETVVACLVGAITVMLSSLLTPPATLKIVTALGPGRLIFTASALYCIMYLVDYMAELSSANPTLKVAISLKIWGALLLAAGHFAMISTKPTSERTRGDWCYLSGCLALSTLFARAYAGVDAGSRELLFVAGALLIISFAGSYRNTKGEDPLVLLGLTGSAGLMAVAILQKMGDHGLVDAVKAGVITPLLSQGVSCCFLVANSAGLLRMGPPKLIRYGVRMNYVGQTLKCMGSLSLFIAGALGIGLGGKDTIRVVFKAVAVAMDGTYASPDTIEQGFVYIAKFNAAVMLIWSTLPTQADMLNDATQEPKPKAKTKKEMKQDMKLKRRPDPKARPASKAKQKAKTKGKGKGKAKEQ